MDQRMVFLNVGSGKNKIDGFINIDSAPGGDLQLDFSKGLPFCTGSVQGIFGEHFIEKLSQAEAVAFLRECRRVLANNGLLRIATADLDSIIGAYQSADWKAANQEWERRGYGWIDNRSEQINLAMREWERRWLYNEEELVRLCVVAGLKPVGRCRTGESETLLFRGLESGTGPSLIYEFTKQRPAVPAQKRLVSILIPAYNPRYFEASFKSALAQSYPELEIIVCDDNPATNEIQKIVSESAAGDGRVRYFRNEKNLGGRGNLVRLLDLASGEYIKFLNDDDLLHSKCVETMAMCLDCFPESTLVTSRRQFIDAEGRYMPLWPGIVSRDSLLDGTCLADSMLKSKNNCIGEPTTVMFRKADLAGTKPDIFSFGGRPALASVDVTIWVTLLSKGDAVYLIEPLSYFRIHEDQAQKQPEYKRKAPLAWEQIRFDAKRMGLLREDRSGDAGVTPLAAIDRAAGLVKSLDELDKSKNEKVVRGPRVQGENSVEKNREVWSSYDWRTKGDEWSGAWGGSDNLWNDTILPRIKRFIPAKQVLEIAPGFGRCTEFLADQSERLTVVDLTPICIDACKERFRNRNTISYFVNDGKSLGMVADESIDFVFSWDSLVHADAGVISSYLRELKKKLKPGGAGFIHHSNMGEFFDPSTGAPTVENKHWRGISVSAELFRAVCREVGLRCVSQEIIAWGGDILCDCFSIITKEGNKTGQDCMIVRNPGFMAEAKAAREKFVKHSEPQAVYLRAHDLLRNKRDGQAFVLFEDLVRLHSGFAAGHNDYAVLLLQKKDLEKARNHFERAVQLDPEKTKYVRNLADYYFTIDKRYGDALLLYNKLIKSQPEDAELRLISAHILIRLNRLGEAREHLQAVLSIDKGNEVAHETLQHIDKVMHLPIPVK